MAINQSLAHGLNVLLLYDADHLSLTVAEISKMLNFSQSKTYRMIRTLTQYGLLRENPGTARYSLGLNALRIGLLAQQNFNISQVARPLMKELSVQTKETVLLTAVNGTKGICLERVESDEPIRYSMFQPGAILPLHAGASSKVLMAYLPEGEWDRIIEKERLVRFTPYTIIDASKLKAHLREIRRKGYAFSDQEVDREVRAVAAPVLNAMGELVAGLSIAGPAYRISKKRVSELGKLMVQYAQKVTSQLEFGGTVLPVKVRQRKWRSPA
jgi:IclR family transcriptional regulator, KDG regulon repressor